MRVIKKEFVRAGIVKSELGIPERTLADWRNKDKITVYHIQGTPEKSYFYDLEEIKLLKQK